MLGRGLVADPGLARAIAQPGGDAIGWDDVLPLLQGYWRDVAAQVAPRHRCGRVKQWLNLLRRRFAQAQAAYDRVRAVNDGPTFERLLLGMGSPTPGVTKPCVSFPECSSASALA